MARTPRLDAIEARLDATEEIVTKLEEVVATLVPEPPVPVDPVDIPDPDGTTPRQKWIKGCQDVVDGAAAKGETITMSEANERLLNMANSGQLGPKPAGEI